METLHDLNFITTERVLSHVKVIDDATSVLNLVTAHPENCPLQMEAVFL